MPEETTRDVPFDEGDVRWLFPAASPGTPVHCALAGISGKMGKLAESFGARAPGSASGLQYTVIGGFPIAGLSGRVEVSDVIFRADLYFLRRCGWDLSNGPPWTVEASIEVRVPNADGFMDTNECFDDGYDYIAIEQMTDIVTTEDEAVVRFDAMVDWLIGRSAAEDLAYWHLQADQAPPENRL